MEEKDIEKLHSGDDDSFRTAEDLSSDIAKDFAVAASSPNEPTAASSSTKKKRAIIEDDFFSLSSGRLDKKKNKKSKHKKSKSQGSDPIASETAIRQVSARTVDQREESSTTKEIHEYVEITETIESTKKTARVKATESSRRVDNVNQLQESVSRDINNKLKLDDQLLSDDDDDDFELNFLKSKTSFTPSTQPDDQYNFSDENEKKRRYIIKVHTKLEVPPSYATGVSMDFGLKGSKKFEKIHKSVVEFFRNQFMGKLEPVYLNEYKTENTSLIWVEGKMELKPFFKPSTLRIQPPSAFDILANEVDKMDPTYLTCILIPKSHLPNFLSMYEEFRISKPYLQSSEVSDVVESLEKFEREQSLAESSGDEITVIDLENMAEEDNNDNDNFFVIGLKGRDNKRIEVQVSPETVLRKLLTHYMKVKEIDENTVDMTKVRLVFDDEDMNLDDKVGDTELEEDFEIQVVL
ncbi:ubiquitin-2 like Rad60 SUMO-like-domain-containing protein [Scheffersomyces xylosifermentans]|uniref:ubiquitin-2 like Rad60 SUMO-like-domain-containing protein n=1 Tax=Scheffersomyces xylosifermentans TaxID=1304137 RepID=UPI00315D4515